MRYSHLLKPQYSLYGCLRFRHLMCATKIWCLWHCGLWNKPGLLVQDMIYCDPPILLPQHSQQTLIISPSNKSYYVRLIKKKWKGSCYPSTLSWCELLSCRDICILSDIMEIDVATVFFLPNYTISLPRRTRASTHGGNVNVNGILFGSMHNGYDSDTLLPKWPSAHYLPPTKHFPHRPPF